MNHAPSMNLRKANSFFDFIEVDLYGEYPGYKVKVGMPYWFYNGEYVKHEVTEALYYREIEEYVKEGMIYVEDEGRAVNI